MAETMTPAEVRHQLQRTILEARAVRITFEVSGYVTEVHTVAPPDGSVSARITVTPSLDGPRFGPVELPLDGIVGIEVR